jgi:hypothetical protein
MGSVADWSEYSDPTELLMRLDVLLQENAELRDEIEQLRAGRTRPGTASAPVGSRTALPTGPETVRSPPPASGHPGLPDAHASSTTEAKIALFRTLFAGREDVYATRWLSAKSGRTGWSPAEDNPFEKNKDETRRRFWPLTDQVVYQHLSRPEPGGREVHLGIYPLLALGIHREPVISGFRGVGVRKGAPDLG